MEAEIHSLVPFRLVKIYCKNLIILIRNGTADIARVRLEIFETFIFTENKGLGIAFFLFVIIFVFVDSLSPEIKKSKNLLGLGMFQRP